MKNFLKHFKLPLIIGVVAFILVMIDAFISHFFLGGGSFTWVAFVSWTLFDSASKKERVKSILGYVSGFFFANLMITLGGFFINFVNFKGFWTCLCVALAVGLVNIIIILFGNAKKFTIGSIPGIFTGCAMTFSGVGKMFPASDLKLFAIIFIYGILGHLCAISVHFLNKKFKNIENGDIEEQEILEEKVEK